MRFNNCFNPALVVVLALAFVPQTYAYAGLETDDPARPTFGQTGELFTLKFSPADQRLIVSFVDQPVVSVGPARVEVRGRVFSSNNKQNKALVISPQDDSFKILDTIDPNSRLEIEVHDLINHKKETFKLEQKAKP